MSPWRKFIAVKLPPFLSWSEKCSKFGHVTLTHWFFKSLLHQSFGQTFFWKCVKKVLLKISINFRMYEHWFCPSRTFYCIFNVTLTRPYCKYMVLNELQNQWFFGVNFLCLINWCNSGWCFAFFLKSTCSLELNIYVTLTQTFQAIEEEVGPKLLFVDFWLQHLTSGAERLG